MLLINVCPHEKENFPWPGNGDTLRGKNYGTPCNLQFLLEIYDFIRANFIHSREISVSLSLSRKKSLNTRSKMNWTIDRAILILVN